MLCNANITITGQISGTQQNISLSTIRDDIDSSLNEDTFRSWVMTKRNIHVHMTVLSIRQIYVQWTLSTTHPWSGKTLGSSHIREIKIWARSRPSWSLFLLHVFSENVSPGQLNTGQSRPGSQQFWSSGPAGSKDGLLTAWLNMRRCRKEPVGGGAVDVDQVADAALTFSCLLPENHGIQGWC